MSQPVVDLAQAIRVERLIGRARGLVQTSPPAREQALVRDVLGEGVLEDMHGLALAALLVDELQAPELREVGLEATGAAPDGVEQPERELASQHRGGLEHPPRFLRQPVDARPQHVVDAAGHRVLRPGGRVLEHGPSQLLQEEGVAVGLVQDRLERVGIRSALAEDGAQHHEALRQGQPRQGELRRV